MEGQQDRRRSLSVGHRNGSSINLTTSSPQYLNHDSFLDLDPSTSSSTFTTGAFNTGVPSVSGAEQYSFQNDFLPSTAQGPPFQQHMLPSNDFADQDFSQPFRQRNSSSNGQQRPSQLTLQQSNHRLSGDFLNTERTTTFTDPFQQDMPQKQDVLMLNPSLQSSNQPHNQSINPADIMSNMSSPQNHLATPPNLMSLDPLSSSGQAPSPQQRLYSPNHSRQVSLEPASAAFMHGQQPTDWTGMLGAAFQQRRRAPSEHSEVSSVTPSPFLPQQDSFETYDQGHSPMLKPQQDSSLYQDAAFGIERFSLADQQQQQQKQQQHQHQHQQRRGMSPGQSPYISPQMSPHHQGLGISQENPFGILNSTEISNQFSGGPGPQIYNGQSEPDFSNFRLKHETSDMGQAAQMAPPEINVELAPPSRQQHFELHNTENDLDALSPPERGRRGRIRAKSDPSFHPIPRATSPAEASSDLMTMEVNQRNRSLSPFDASPASNVSRDVSPASRSSRRSSTSSIPNRDYILELADPTRPSANGTDRQGRVQKHPATFQCTLCPKRFTRAYNLRSHLRTHTDERPFVCTVCGKAFARQHDRKRHEGLHSGEKKFVCRGELGGGGSWGCGRRFARADALGRHFRSEAGRVCIKPLLDEEALERQRLYEEQMRQQQGMQGPGNGLQPPSQMMDMNGGAFTLPAALLAQYPALQGLQWDQLSTAGGPGDEGELSGRSSFDASSGGDYFDEEEASGYVSGPGTSYGNAWGAPAANHDWASDYEGR